MRIKRRRKDPGTSTEGLPPAGADLYLFGTTADVPWLERKSRNKAFAVQRKAERRVRRRKLRRALKQALRPGLVLALEMVGIVGLVWTARLIWLPLAWGLASAVCIGLALVLDTDESPGSE